MSWRVNPTIYKGPVDMQFGPFPTIFSPIALTSPVLSGQGADAGLIAYLPKESLSSLNDYTISATVSYRLTSPDNQFTRQGGLINEWPWYRSLYNQIYYTPGYGFVMMDNTKFPGYTPVEWLDAYAVWQGDSFYVGATIPGISSIADVVFSGRGVLQRTDPVPTVTVSFSWPRWCRVASADTPYGLYTAVDGSGATGTKFIGNPYWTYGPQRFVRSAEKVAGRYEYSGMTYRSLNAYVIGTVGSEDGWLVGDEPDIGYNRTFNFAKPAGSEITGESIVLTWAGYTPGDVRETVYMGEIGVYR